MKILKKILDLHTKKERNRATMLMVMMLVMAMLDLVGVASIMPLIAVLANPQLVESDSLLYFLYSNLSFKSPQSFLFALGMAAFFLVVVSLAFKALTSYSQIRFVLMLEFSIGKRLIEGYLHQPYSWFLNQHSADLGKNILSEVNLVTSGCILPLMNLIAQGIVCLALMILLLAVDPLLACSVGAVLGIAYITILFLTSNWLKRLGKARIEANQKRFTSVSEAFGAVKEVKLGGLEQVCIDGFSGPAKIYATAHATVQLIAQSPRFMLEAIAFGGMLLVTLYLMVSSSNFNNVLPVIALYAFAGYRLMPALQQIYGAITQLRFAGPALNVLHDNLMSLRDVDRKQSNKKTPIPITEGIVLNKIVYRYPKATQTALKGINFMIPAYSTIGLMGATGSGKTTTVDLILGLLEPQEGFISVDGMVINDVNRGDWQRSIGYVPQHIYLADDSVAANIAFGLNVNDIDLQSIERAAKIAKLHEFITSELPYGYDTKVGERGVRLSGGQRQRIGIARAMYHKPQLLILDEATSALDNLTEQMVMDAVNNLDYKVTTILIAHRLSTLRQCDRIYFLERGEIKASGTYEELVSGGK